MRIDLPHPEQFSAIFETLMLKKLNHSVSGVSIDSRNVKEGDLFIAIEGKKLDGHTFLDDVFNKGASAAIVNKRNTDIQLQQFRKSNPVLALAEIASEYRVQYDLPIIGITGSNGKTSTKELLKHLLARKFNVHSTQENQNTIIGLSLNLLKISSAHNISIIEIGASKKGEIKRLCKIARPTHGLVTNISSAHLDGFGSIINISNEKEQLFKSLGTGIAFVNSTDQYICKMSIKCEKISFGLDPDCDFSGDIKEEKDGSLTLILNANTIPTYSHNLSHVKNLIAASSIAITLGLEWKDLIEQVKTFTPPDGRCKVFIKNDVTIIDDTYNANLSSSLAALDYLKTFSSKGRKIFVFGDMFELGDLTSKQHQIVGEKCTEVGIDIVFTIGNHSRETHNALNPKIYKLHFKKQLNLITALKLNIKSNDIILIKGSRGMFMENVLKEIF